jgi:peptidoglycan/xylan/chitin deacetylase (PgdA/CDA1 family)
LAELDRMDDNTFHPGATEARLPADFRWPGGKRLAVFFRCAFQGWSQQHWANISPPGDPFDSSVPDPNAAGFVEYGHRRGIFRVLDTFARTGLKATMIVSGIMAERHPEILRQMSQAGHDIVAHSYAMEAIPLFLDEEDERLNIRRTAELIERAAGKRPTGWISPRFLPSRRTPRLLSEEGFDWYGDVLNDDLPYVVHFKTAPLVAFPSSLECNDLSLYLRHPTPPRLMLEMFEDWLDYARRYETGATRIDPTIHAHLFGRPAGMAVLQRMIEIAQAAEDLWISTQSGAVRYILTHHARAVSPLARRRLRGPR